MKNGTTILYVFLTMLMVAIFMHAIITGCTYHNIVVYYSTSKKTPEKIVVDGVDMGIDYLVTNKINEYEKIWVK